MTATVRAEERARPPTPATAQRRFVALCATAAALPTLLGGLIGGGFLSDDWGVWLLFDRLGARDAMWQLAFEQPARPIAAPYYAFIYLVIGDHPVVQALILAAINAFLVFTAWWCGKRFLPARVLLPALAVLALAPNHGMTRLWFVVGTYPLALALVFLGIRELDRRRSVLAAAVLVAATLLYEGTVALAMGLVGVWVFLEWRHRLRDGLVVAIPTVFVAALSFLLSPKLDAPGPDPFDNLDTFLPAQLGTGMWEIPLVAQVFGGLILVALAVSALVQLPSWRSRRVEPRLLLLGAGLAVLSAAPFFVPGSIFATAGLFDRNNLVPGVGVALMLGALWSLLRSWSRPVAIGVGAIVIAWFAVLQVQDVMRFADAVEEGDGIVEALATMPGIDDERPILVVPQQRSKGRGLADFVANGDLIGALRYRHEGDWAGVRLVRKADCAALANASAPVQVFDWTSEDLRLLSPTEAVLVCRSAKTSPEGEC